MNTKMKTEKCFSCGAIIPAIEGEVHAYMDASPGCWHLFNLILEKEYSDSAYRKNSRLTTDAYAVQHYGKRSIPQAVKSVNHHLISLCCYFEYKMTVSQCDSAFRSLSVHKGKYTWLTPPQKVGAITVAEVIRADSVEHHLQLVEQWAWEAWDSWRIHHDTIKKFIAQYYRF
jgi:hypothetical protein